MIQEGLVTKLALDQSEQEIVEEIVNKAVGEAVEMLLADYNLQNPWAVAHSSPTVYDPGQSDIEMLGTSCTLSDLHLNPMPPSTTWRTATPTSTVMSSEEELRPDLYDRQFWRDMNSTLRPKTREELDILFSDTFSLWPVGARKDMAH
jgi:hypothetical protein